MSITSSSLIALFPSLTSQSGKELGHKGTKKYHTSGSQFIYHSTKAGTHAKTDATDYLAALKAFKKRSSTNASFKPYLIITGAIAPLARSALEKNNVAILEAPQAGGVETPIVVPVRGAKKGVAKKPARAPKMVTAVGE